MMSTTENNTENTKTRFSYSALSGFKSCPRSYKFKYIDKLPSAFTSIEAHMGTSVHAALEWTFRERMEGREPQKSEAIRLFKEYFWNSDELENAKVIKAGKTTEHYFQEGKLFLSAYFDRVLPGEKGETIYLEHTFVIDLNEEYKFKGIIDRISRDQDGIIRVTDYKTGRVGHPLDNLQLPSYSLYIFGCNMDDEIRLCIEDLREGKTLLVPFARREARRVRDSLLTRIDEIVSTESFPPNPSVLCHWCGYNHICENPHESVKAGMGFQSSDAENAPEKKVTLVMSKSGGERESIDEFQGCCPQCGGELRERNGRFGTFWGCSNFPECKYTFDTSGGLQPGGVVVNEHTDGKDICPECGSLLKERNGRFGKFVGCTAYPECRFTRNIDD